MRSERGGAKGARALQTGHGALRLPAFLPDATRGVVRAVDSTDLVSCGVGGLMVNALHLSSHPGTSLIASARGIHRFMGWDGPVASDSGGFQVLSLIAASSGMGNISSRGFAYRLGRGQKKRMLTPEKCIQKQFQIGADLMFCLDHCTHPGEDRAAQAASVAHTVEWARQCRAAFDRRMEQGAQEEPRPLLFGVVQGGEDRALRRECAESLLEIGFDGYGYGGWPIDAEGGLVDGVGYVAELIPEEFPRHGLGIGKPENLLRAFELGYDTFDCAIPTRDARRKRLYLLNSGLEAVGRGSEGFYRYLYIGDERYARDRKPVDERCDCLCCRRYSRAYLHHLFGVDNASAYRLATIHNLKFYMNLMGRLQAL